MEFCNENLVLHKYVTSEFITTTCIDFFVVAITPITTTLVVIATTFFHSIKSFFLQCIVRIIKFEREK